MKGVGVPKVARMFHLRGGTGRTPSEKMKKIITHLNPDLDAVTSVWLIKRFLPASPAGGPGWEEVKVEFVNAGSSTEKNPQVDTDPNVLWVDVGRGKLDHHQSDKLPPAAKLCLDYIKEKRKGRPISPLEEKALVELVGVVVEVDEAHDLNWPEAKESRYQFYLDNLIDGLAGLGKEDKEIMNFSLEALDAVFLNLKHQIRADEDLKEGIVFQTPWGRAIALESANKQVASRGEVRGYLLVVTKDPETGGVRIHSRPDSKVDLTEACKKFKKMDPESDWFLHATKRLLLNQASVNPKMRPTKLSLEEIIKVLKEI